MHGFAPLTYCMQYGGTQCHLCIATLLRPTQEEGVTKQESSRRFKLTYPEEKNRPCGLLFFQPNSFPRALFPGSNLPPPVLPGSLTLATAIVKTPKFLLLFRYVVDCEVIKSLFWEASGVAIPYLFWAG